MRGSALEKVIHGRPEPISQLVVVFVARRPSLLPLLLQVLDCLSSRFPIGGRKGLGASAEGFFLAPVVLALAVAAPKRKLPVGWKNCFWADRNRCQRDSSYSRPAEPTCFHCS